MRVFESMALEPWVVATAGLRARLAQAPLGVPRGDLRWYDPTRCASAPFLDHLERLDELTFGPHDLRMPRWAFYDCAELPGALFGFGGSGDRLPKGTPALSAEAGVFVPVSMCMAIPMVLPDAWLVFSVSSLLDLAPGPEASALGVETLALTLAALRPRRVTGTVQWRSPSLEAHGRFAPLQVRAAWVPAHTLPATCVFAFDVHDAGIERALAGIDGGSGEGRVVDPDDFAALQAMQSRIEAGDSLSLVGTTREGLARVVWGQP